MSEAGTGDAPLLRVEQLTIRFRRAAERAHAVEDVGLTVARGEIVCLVGESGSGKSMTAAAIMGLLPGEVVEVATGRIRLDGEDLLGLDERRWCALRGRRMAMIFQEPMSALDPLHRVGDQAAEVLRIHTGLRRRERRHRVIELFGAVGLPDPEALFRSYPFRLSGGQRQRVMIAMALALGPGLLIADEPTTALDVTAQMEILRLIRRIQGETGMGVLFITHDFGVVAEIADRVLVMQEGRLVEEGRTATVLRHPAHPYTRQLIAAVPQGAGARRKPLETASPLLELRGLEKRFNRPGRLWRQGGEVWAARNIDLAVRRGETLGLVGESGSGKSTVARCIVRLLEPAGGEIRFDGALLTGLGRRALKPFRRRIQMIFQDPFASLNPRQKIGDIIAEGPLIHGAPAAVARRRARELLDLVGLDPAVAERYPHEFSGGERQRIGIARALATGPDLIIADEPVSALDVSIQAQILEMLDALRRRLSLSMLFITYDLRVAAQVCDRVAVMWRGEIVEQGPVEEVFAAPRHDYTRQLLDSIPGKDWLPPVHRLAEDRGNP